MKVYYIILLNYQLTGHKKNFKIKLLFSRKIKSLILHNLEVTVSISYMFLAI